MSDEAEIASSSDFGIELFDGACASIAGVHEEIIADFFAFFVDAFELGEGDVDFASDFENLGDLVGGELQGERFDGSDGVGDIVAVLAIATGECSDEDAVFVSDGEGDAVDFGFADEGGWMEFRI